jgi:hypothetical protein
VQLYAESTDSLCSFASPTVPRLGLTGFSEFTTAQGVHCVGKDVISQIRGNGAMDKFLEEAMFTARVVRMYHDCDLKDAMLTVLRGGVVYINISNLVKLFNDKRAICWPMMTLLNHCALQLAQNLALAATYSNPAFWKVPHP